MKITKKIKKVFSKKKGNKEEKKQVKKDEIKENIGEIELEEDESFCDYCNKIFKDNNLIFSRCQHKICDSCIFERIFIYHISELQGQDKLIISCECENSFLDLSLNQILNILKNKEKREQKVSKTKNITSGCECLKIRRDSNAQLFSDFFCLDCLDWVCKDCKYEENNYHFYHRVFKSRQLIQYTKDIINNIYLKNKNIASFEQKWEKESNNFKNEFDTKFNKSIEKLDQLIESAQELKQNYIEEYERQIKNYIKTFKIIKFFYKFYFEDRQAELNKTNPENNDIFKLKYLANITSEFVDFGFRHSEELENKVLEIKEKIDDLKKSNIKIIDTKFKFEKIDKKYNKDNESLVGHKQFITSLISMNNKIISGSLDYSMKIWECNEEGKYKMKQEIKTKQIISLLGLKNGKILASSKSENDIMIYSLNSNEEYQKSQSLTNHSNIVTTMAELEDGKFISCSIDGMINVWEENKKYKQYEVKQTITTKKQIALLTALDDFKIAYTTSVNGIISIMEAKTEYLENRLISKDFNQVGDLEKQKGKVSCMCKLNNGYFASGGGNINNNIDHNIYIWKPEGNSFALGQIINDAHKADINSIILLRDGKIASSSKDRIIKIWAVSKINNGSINYILNQEYNYNHGLYKLIQLLDDRLVASTSDHNLIFLKNNNGIF